MANGSDTQGLARIKSKECNSQLSHQWTSMSKATKKGKKRGK